MIRHYSHIRGSVTYFCVFSRLYLLRQTHKEDIGAVGQPVIVELVFGLASDCVVTGLQGLEELG